jgi:3-oxoacyl-[acyl-carrier protein] reductase
MENKRALVLGASQGIGEAVAKGLASDGVSVCLFSRSEEKLKKIVSDLPGDGHNYIAGDIGRSETWQGAIGAEHEKAPFNIVILNSGGPKGGPISKAMPEEFLGGMNNHLIANSMITRIVLDEMKKKNWGRFVTITSTSVKIPIPHLGVSNTVRAAVASWGKTLSLELAPHGITVNNVMPGFTQTPRLESLIRAKADQENKSYADVEREWMSKVPMKRFAQPEETADLIRFICSEKANYITGQSIAVDGGRVGAI